MKEMKTLWKKEKLFFVAFYVATARKPHSALTTLMGLLLRVFYVYRDCTVTSRHSNHAHVALTARLLCI